MTIRHGVKVFMRFSFKHLAWLGMAILLLSATASAHDPKTAPLKLPIATDDYPPYSSRSEGGSGAIADIVREAFAAEGVEVEYQFGSWKRCELMTAAGEVFGAIPYFVNEERQQSFDFSAPLALGFTRFFYNKERFPNGFDWQSLADFKGYRMGAIPGYWYLSEFQEAGLDVHLVGTEEQNFVKLAKQRIDFTLAGQPRAEEVIRNIDPELSAKIGMVRKPESFDTFHVLVSRTFPDAELYNKLLTSGLVKIIDSGVYHQILERYELSSDYAVDRETLSSSAN